MFISGMTRTLEVATWDYLNSLLFPPYVIVGRYLVDQINIAIPRAIPLALLEIPITTITLAQRQCGNVN